MPENPILEPEYDLIIVGSGAGSMGAALAARKLGKCPVILEKLEVVGGTTSYSGGVCWVPANRWMAQEGISDSKDRARTYFDQVVTYQGPSVTNARRDAFLNAAPRVFDALCGMGLRMRRPDHDYPDYRDLPGSEARGRVIVSEPFNVRELGAWRALLGMYPRLNSCRWPATR